MQARADSRSSSCAAARKPRLCSACSSSRTYSVRSIICRGPKAAGNASWHTPLVISVSAACGPKIELVANSGTVSQPESGILNLTDGFYTNQRIPNTVFTRSVLSSSVSNQKVVSCLNDKLRQVVLLAACSVSFYGVVHGVTTIKAILNLAPPPSRPDLSTTEAGKSNAGTALALCICGTEQCQHLLLHPGPLDWQKGAE